MLCQGCCFDPTESKGTARLVRSLSGFEAGFFAPDSQAGPIFALRGGYRAGLPDRPSDLGKSGAGEGSARRLAVGNADALGLAGREVTTNSVHSVSSITSTVTFFYTLRSISAKTELEKQS